jgi:hypothetical protein
LLRASKRDAHCGMHSAAHEPDAATPMRHAFEGSCHCGALGFEFHTALAPAQWCVRACLCSYCRAHGARTTSDRAGSVTFRLSDSALLQRYRFDSHSADFLLCRRCGVYVAAVLTTAQGQVATLNVNAMHGAGDAAAVTAVSYDGEVRERRILRRAERWTPLSTSL